MLKIEVMVQDFTIRSGTSGRTGKPYSMREQSAYLHTGKPYPDELKITLDDNQPPYPVGVYTLAENSFYVDKFKGLACRPVLVPVQPERK